MGEAAAQELLAVVRDWLATFDTAPVADFRGEVASAMPPRRLPARPLPCLIHLPRAAGIASGGAGSIAGLLARHAAALHWGQTYTAADFGQKFIDNYGWLEVFGTRGHFANDNIAGGFLVLGPGIEYPDHHHVAEEIYIPLTSGHRMAHGRRRLRSRAGRRGHPPRLQCQPRHAHRRRAAARLLSLARRAARRPLDHHRSVQQGGG